MLVHQNISLKPYNTFRIDVKARFMAEIGSIDDLDEAYHTPAYRAYPKIVLGGGSNILFKGPQRKVLLKMNLGGIEVVRESAHYVWIKVGAGEIWHQLVLWCIENNLGGIENLSLIPGTVGAAPMQNIGAYGTELKEVFERLEAYEIANGKLRTFEKEECKFGYRYSVFKGQLRDKFIITHVTFRLSKKPKFNIEYGDIRNTLNDMGVSSLSIKAISEAIIHIRQNKLPDPAVIGNAGSFFKNPIVEKPHFEALQAVFPNIPNFPVSDDWVKIPAAWLIDQCGWKGKRRGDAGVHDRQALVLVNHGKAKGADIIKLSELIQTSVQHKFGVELNREVNIV